MSQPDRTGEILKRIRNSPPGDVYLTHEETYILDPLFATGWPMVGYYAGHRVMTPPPRWCEAEELTLP